MYSTSRPGLSVATSNHLHYYNDGVDMGAREPAVRAALLETFP